MKPRIYSYPNNTYRGYVTTYQGNVMTPVLCDVVRKNKLKALSDAKKLLFKIRKNE